MPYYVRDSGGNWIDSLLRPIYFRNGAAWSRLKEGDFYRSAGGAWNPILRFTSQPFGGWVSGTDMVFQLGMSPTLRTVNAKLACGGSSTMAGFGLSAPNRLEDRLLVWLNATGTGATLNNFAVAGYTLANLRTVANGGTTGQNCEAMAAVRPTFVFILEPTNWAASYDEATQIAYMLELTTYFFARGIVPFFGSSMPRTPYSGVQDTRLVNLSAQLKAHPVLKYLTVPLFDDFLKAGTTADLREDYDQGDGIHLNAAGVQAVSDRVAAFVTNALRTVTAFDRYEIERSADGSTGWAVIDTITDMTINRRTLTGVTGYYRARARLKASGAYVAYSATTFLNFSGPSVEMKFNFNRTAQSTPDWVDVSGQFHVADINSAVYPGTTVFIRTKATNASAVNIWGNTAGDSSNNSVGQTTGANTGAFPDNVLLSNGFTTGQTYAAGNEQIEIRGLTPGASYTIKAIGSRVASAVPLATRLMDWTVVDANGTQTVENYDVKGNTANLVTFTGKVADVNGVIKVAINRPTPTDTNHNFGYCNGLTIKQE